jgi:hypothetical protein
MITFQRFRKATFIAAICTVKKVGFKKGVKMNLLIGNSEGKNK